jgi:1-acyl-sn-glycerol-3-phosphate acyltransferase
VTHPSSPPTDRSRLLRAGAVLAGERLRPPVGDARRRTVCGAARLLTGLGVRVAVHAPAEAWPRTRSGPGLLLVANSASPLDPLVLLTVLRGVVVAAPAHQRVAGVPCPSVPATVADVAAALARGTSVVVRPELPTDGGTALGRFSPDLLTAAVGTGAPVCPVAVRCSGGAPGPVSGARSLRAALRWTGGVDVLADVHLLPALSSAGATPQELATTAEYAVAAVLETVTRQGGLAAGARPEPARGGGQRGPSTTR